LHLKTCLIYRDIINADVVINVPILKHHDITGLTISMKNLIGVIGGNRGKIHNQIDQNLCDLTRLLPVELVIVDAYRILTQNGPSGGNLKDVRNSNQIIVSNNSIMADAYSAKLFGIEPDTLNFLKLAYKQGLGEIYPNKMKIKKIKA
jgi:uncharacterized protein (DUF362 family)